MPSHHPVVGSPGRRPCLARPGDAHPSCSPAMAWAVQEARHSPAPVEWDPSDWSTPRSRGSLAVVPRGYGHVAASSSSTTRSSVRNVAPQTPQTPSGMKRSAQCSQTRQAHAAVAVATRNCRKLPAAAGMACCSGGREASAVVSEQAQGAVSVTFSTDRTSVEAAWRSVTAGPPARPRGPAPACYSVS